MGKKKLKSKIVFKYKNWVIKFIIIIITLVSVLYGIELFAKIFNSKIKIVHDNIEPGIGGKDVLEYPSGYIKDRELFWKWDSSQIEFNSAGFWDKEISFKKEDGVFRIICMGDSITFGWPIEREKTYPKQLEALLSQNFYNKIEVFNAGVSGYTSYQCLKWFQSDILKYDPDCIILYFGVNDAGLSTNNKSDKEQFLLPEWAVFSLNHLRKFESFKLWQKIFLRFKYPINKNNYRTKYRVSPEDYRENIKSINRIAEGYGIKTLFLVSPVYYTPEDRIVSTKKEYYPPDGIYCLDLYDIFKEKEKEAAEIFLDDARPDNIHLTGKGQIFLAEKVYEKLVGDSIIKNIK